MGMRDRAYNVDDTTSNLRFELVHAVLTLIASTNCLRFGEPPKAPQRRLQAQKNLDRFVEVGSLSVLTGPWLHC